VASSALLGVLLGFSFGDVSVSLEIGLVACQGEDDALGGVLLELGDPLFGLGEALDGGDVVADDGSCGFSVVDGRHGVVLLLPGSVLNDGRSTQIVSLTLCSLSRVTFFSR
jgi:hypothetical protein